MAGNLIELWTGDYQQVAHKIQELEIAGSERLDDLLVMLSSDIGTHGTGAPMTEGRVDELLGSAAGPRRLLSEIDALDAAAQRWRGALGGLREAVQTQECPAAPLREKPGLCEADDEYWYL